MSPTEAIATIRTLVPAGTTIGVQQISHSPGWNPDRLVEEHHIFCIKHQLGAKDPEFYECGRGETRNEAVANLLGKLKPVPQQREAA